MSQKIVEDSVVISIRLSTEMSEKIKAAGKKKMQSRSVVIRDILYGVFGPDAE